MTVLRGPGRRLLGRVLAGAVVAAALVVTALAVQERAELRAEAHAHAHEAVEDLVVAGETRSEIADLQASVAAAGQAQAEDDQATVEIITALDELTTLRDRIELAELELGRVREVSDTQAEQLRILHSCANALEEARVRLLDGDVDGATAHLAVGTDSCQQAEELAEGTSASHPFDFADPQIMRDGGTYYAFGTNGPAGTVQVISSSDLTDWEVRGSALSGVPGWAEVGYTWAPAAIKTSAGYSLFYTVRQESSGKQCISRATASAPGGPYVDSSTGPLICQLAESGSIDPSPYTDETGKLYLTWKSEGETGDGEAAIWTAELAADGAKLVSFPTQLLSVSKEWEGRTIEGPTMARAAGRWVLVYAGNRWNTAAYATGYATCAGPTGPCEKPSDNVVLRSDGDREGPGGAELFRSSDGQLKVVYAAWDAGEVGYPNPRRLHLATASWTPLGLRIS